MSQIASILPPPITESSQEQRTEREKFLLMIAGFMSEHIIKTCEEKSLNDSLTQTVSCFIIATFISLSAIAQPYFGVSANNRGVGIQAGALISQMVDINILYNSRITNKAATPSSLTINAGLRLILSDDETTQVFLTPAIGYANTKYKDFSEYHIAPDYKIIDVNESRVNYSLELAKQRNNIRLFVSGSYALKAYAAVGVKVFFN